MNLSTADLLKVVGLHHPLAYERLRTLTVEELLSFVDISHPVARERWSFFTRMAVGGETSRAPLDAVGPDSRPTPPSSGVYEREDAQAIVARVLKACAPANTANASGVDSTNGEGREGEEHGGSAERGEQHRVNLTSAKRAGESR